MEINLKIKQCLEENGIRQEFLATKSNMSKVAISNIVNGKRKVAAEELKRIAKALNKDISFFYN
jgi:transcriptional regulator with XRE-family HTH domain